MRQNEAGAKVELTKICLHAALVGAWHTLPFKTAPVTLVAQVSSALWSPLLRCYPQSWALPAQA